MKQWLLVFLLAGCACAAPAPSTLIANVSGRNGLSLNGSWNVIVDPFDNGNRGFFRDAKPKDKADLVEYSFDASPVMNVPGDWNTQRESLMFYEGPVWQRRLFTYRKHAGRQFIYFGAVNYRATVYLNGEKLGEHEGGFTAFNFECTSQLRDGENTLIVEVNSIRHADGVPGIKYDWWNYGGITRDVKLIELPELFIQDYWVQLAKGSQNEIAGWVQLNGAQAGQKISVEIPQAGIRLSAVANKDGHANFQTAAKLELWSPEDPKLYDVTISAGSDKLQDQIGFRTIEVQGAKILLNGKAIFLRGISMHEEAPFREGRAFSPGDAQILLGWAKELGCNFVRLAHYPHNENEIRLADRLGLLLWSEIPVYWDIDWTSPATLANAEAQLRDMIARDHNRAAVIFWSMSNETPVKPERLIFIKQLVSDAREFDSTRLITSALNHVEDAAPDVRTIADPLVNELDVVGVNEYLGWYVGRPQDADKMQWKADFNKPLIVSEFGGGALAGRHGDADERWTEEYQQYLYEHQLAMVQKMPNFAGLTPWVLMDFRSPVRMLPGIQDYHNRKGVISNRGQKKLAFYTLQKFYRERAAEADSRIH
jgi:beta-glucuronidase